MALALVFASQISIPFLTTLGAITESRMLRFKVPCLTAVFNAMFNALWSARGCADKLTVRWRHGIRRYIAWALTWIVRRTGI